MDPLGLIAVGGAILGALGVLVEIVFDGARFVMEGKDLSE